tara:strand:- start:3941 stop:4738 length:798 start_codon:yes stop_codon:yes gene_type:complete
MIKNSLIWVVSDVDGTLMDHSYNLTPAVETINWLKTMSIPVILCTSKTAAEVKIIRKELDLKDPFIVENGAAIYGEYDNGKEWEIILGDSYNSLEQVLRNLSEQINFCLRPLNSLSDKEATLLTGLKGESLTLMRDRHWSMPFLNPPENIEEELKILCKDLNVDIFRGNRMSHLLSKKSNKGKAIKTLIKFSKNKNVRIIGLGDSPNDLPLLKNADFKIVISSVNGPNLKLLDELNDSNFIVSKKPHGYGWREEVIKVVTSLVKK